MTDLVDNLPLLDFIPKEAYLNWGCSCQDFYIVDLDFLLHEGVIDQISDEWKIFLTQKATVNSCENEGEQCFFTYFKSRNREDLLMYKDRFEEFLFNHEHLLEKAMKRERYDRMIDVKGICYKKHKYLIAKLQNWKCYFCLTPLNLDNSPKSEWDHLMPISYGGNNWPINHALTCKKCNRDKRTMDEDEFWIHLTKTKGLFTVKAAKEEVEKNLATKKLINRSAKNIKAGRIELANKQLEEAKVKISMSLNSQYNSPYVR
jgi:5-methylcytosine-specific restriction endonuclease McrA